MIKSLRFRVVVVSAVAFVSPILVLGLWTRFDVSARSREANRREQRLTLETARRRIDDRIEDDQRTIERLCQADPLIQGVVNDLVANRFAPFRQDEVALRLAPLASAIDFDTLEIVDTRPSFRGEILGSAHRPNRTGAVDRRLVAQLERARGTPFVNRVRLPVNSEERATPVLLHSCAIEDQGVQLHVVGGRALPTSFEDIARALPLERLELRPASHRDSSSTVIAYSDASGAPAYHLVARFAPVQSASAGAVDRWLGALIVTAVILALLMGWVLTKSIARPLVELEQAARRVGSGDLESTLGVRSNNEAARALTAFNRMTQDLKRARERLRRAERTAAWRDIAKRIAHEVKNPLSPIRTAIETLRKTYQGRHPDFDEIFDESTRAVLDEVQRLNRLVTEFSDFARMPAPHRQPVDVAELIQHTAALWHDGDRVSVSVGNTRDLPVIHGDRDQLAEVMTNLVKNAIEAIRETDGPGRVHIEASRWDEGVEVRIDDSGPGIPEAERRRLFDPYYTTKEEGTGLGLAIVQRIVHEHQGSIHIADSSLGGAAMVIRLTVEGPPTAATSYLTKPS